MSLRKTMLGLLILCTLAIVVSRGVRGEGEIYLPVVANGFTPTATSTPDAVATELAEIRATLTALVPTVTKTPTATATSTPTLTNTPTATATHTPTITPTPTNTPTANVVETVIAILTAGAPTWTPTVTATATFVPTAPAP